MVGLDDWEMRRHSSGARCTTHRDAAPLEADFTLSQLKSESV
jgi:hypothetical protein